MNKVIVSVDILSWGLFMTFSVNLLFVDGSRKIAPEENCPPPPSPNSNVNPKPNPDPGRGQFSSWAIFRTTCGRIKFR